MYKMFSNKNFNSILFKYLAIISISLVSFLALSSYLNHQINRYISFNITSVVRNDILIRNYRDTTNELKALTNSQFIDVYFLREPSQKTIFSVVGADNKNHYSFAGKINVPLYFSKDGRKAGDLVFEYNILKNFRYTFVFWVFFSIISLPIVFHFHRLGEKVRASEMESVNSKVREQLSIKVAHDIRSPSEVISAIVDLEASQISHDELQLLKSASQRINSIADDLLVSKPNAYQVETPSPKLLDIEKIIYILIEEKKILFQCKSPRLTSNIQLSKNLAEVKIEENKLKRILSNLLNNSIEAIDRNGSVKVEINDNEKVVTISISDNGSGIDEDTLSKLGKQQVTSKKEKGNGIGVISAAEELAKIGGSLKYSSNYGIGTTAVVALPKG